VATERHGYPSQAQDKNPCPDEGGRLAPFVEAGQRHSGRSMLRPYGTLLRQDASGSRKRQQAAALHRTIVWINLECDGLARVPSAAQRKAGRDEGSGCVKTVAQGGANGGRGG
jgi:hypothetical protein